MMAKNANQISSFYLNSRSIKIPARYELLKQAASDRLLLNWINDAWGKTKNAILDNWESAGLRKKRKPEDPSRKRVGKTGKTSSNVSKELDSKSEKDSDEGKNVTTPARNKSQRQLAEDWGVIQRANVENNQIIVDDIGKSAKSTIDGVSKLLKEKGDDVSNLVKEKGEEVSKLFKEKGML